MIIALLTLIAAIAIIGGEFIPKLKIRRVVVVGAGVVVAISGFASTIQQGKHEERIETSETLQTRMLTSLALAAEEAGQMELRRDSEGNILGGRVVRLNAGAVADTTATADLTTHDKEDAPAASEATATADLTTHSK